MNNWKIIPENWVKAAMPSEYAYAFWYNEKELER